MGKNIIHLIKPAGRSGPYHTLYKHPEVLLLLLLSLNIFILIYLYIFFPQRDASSYCEETVTALQCVTLMQLIQKYIVQYSKDSIIIDIFVHYFLCHGPHHSSLDLTLKTLASLANLIHDLNRKCFT